jgi:hypothetical protein
MTRRRGGDETGRLLNEWYPCTTLLLGDRANYLIERFCEDEPADACLDTAAEVQRLLTFLQSEIARDASLPEYTEEVAAYEGAIGAIAVSDAARLDALFVAEHNMTLPEFRLGALSAHVPVVGRHVRVERYAFNVPRIVAAIEDCDRLEGVEQPAPCTVLLLKLTSVLRPNTLLISDGVRVLLALCDGQRDCAGIVRCLQAEAPTQKKGDFERRILEACEALRAKNVLTYRRPADPAWSER